MLRFIRSKTVRFQQLCELLLDRTLGVWLYGVCVCACFCFVVPWRSVFGQLNSKDHYVIVCVCAVIVTAWRCCAVLCMIWLALSVPGVFKGHS